MFHVNPETGDAGPCKSVKGKCPFGGADVHFTTAEAARHYYEKQQEKLLKITGTKRGAPVVYDIPERNLQLAKDSIAQANRRLEKAGVDERFTYEIEEYMEVKEDPNSGFSTAEPRIRLKVNTPSVKFEGYEFLAAVEKAEAGFVVKAATGVNLRGYSPNSLRCDSCGKAIGRQKTYLVEDSEGKLLQVGSSCVKNYFGVEPKGLWALTFDPIAKATNNDLWNRSSSFYDSAVPTETVLAYALAVSEGGERFVSRGMANNSGQLSTADQVKSAMSSPDSKYRKEVQDEANKYIANGEAKRLLERLKKTATDTDYGRNMSVIANGEWTRFNHMNILISGLSELGREKRAAKKAAHDAKWGAPSAGFAGAVGEKLNGRKFKVYSATHSTKSDPYSYRGGDIDVTKVVFRDEQNHEAIWWASKRVDVKEGDEVTIKSGSVKKHGSYNGVDQTVLQRVRLEEQ